MSSSISAVDICNDAIDMLQGDPIASLTEETATARRFNRTFAKSRDFFLAQHPWNFAVRRAELPEASLPPTHGWNKRYELPGDCLRLLPIRYGNEHEGDLLKYVVEGSDILTDQTAPLKIRYIYRNDQYGTWSPAALEAFSAYLASKVAHAMTKKASFTQLAKAGYDEYLAKAKRLDGLEGVAERPSSQTVLNVRYTGGYNSRYGTRYERFGS